MVRGGGKHVWDKEENKYQYSRRAMEEVQESLEIIKEMYDDAMDVLVTKDKEKAKKLSRRKEKILELDSIMRKGHLKRVNAGS